MLSVFGTTPPVVAFSLYLPAHTTQGPAPFEQALWDFTVDLKKLHEDTPGSFILGGADCNTQLRKMDGHVGKWTGANERPADQERSDFILSSLATLGLNVPSSYVNLGATRIPWPGQKTQQKPSVIDYLFASSKLHYKMHTRDLPTPDTSTDHRPIGMTAYAPYASRKDRRRQFEQSPEVHERWRARLPAQWAPGDLTTLRQKLKEHQIHLASPSCPTPNGGSKTNPKCGRSKTPYQASPARAHPKPEGTIGNSLGRQKSPIA